MILKRPNEDDTDLSGFLLFKKLTDDELNRLNFEKSCSSYKKGTVIYREGSRLTGFYCVTKGIIKVYKTGIDGKEQIIKFAKRGEIIAYRSLLSQELACTTAKVIEEAVLCHVPSHAANRVQRIKGSQRLHYRYCPEISEGEAC
jgi:CRP-like cAMP-binding protein